MGSKAFTAVARSVHTVIPDPDDETEQRRLFGTPKNNLGRVDLPLLSYTMTGHGIETDDGTAWASRVVWGDEVTGSMHDAMRRGVDTGEDRSAVSEAAGWLRDYVESCGGVAASADIKKAGAKAGHPDHALKRARTRAGLVVAHEGFPRVTYWRVPELAPAQSEQAQSEHRRGDVLTVPTVPTVLTESQSEQSGQSETHGGHLSQLRAVRSPDQCAGYSHGGTKPCPAKLEPGTPEREEGLCRSHWTKEIHARWLDKAVGW